MKERPIIFTTESVRAILDGPKTQTRRTYGLKEINRNPDDWDFMRFNKGGVALFWHSSETASNNLEDPDNIRLIKCPYGQAGDRLWVKETWATENQYNSLKPSQIPHSARIWYLADGSRPAQIGKTRSALFMCRWMNRILREITEVRVERVQDISDKDCIAEGCPHALIMLPAVPMQEWFKHLWNSLNAKRGYGWDKNNWVWPISFKKIKGGKI